MKTTVLLTFISLGSALLQAQSTTDPLSAGIKGIYNISRSDVLRAAEKMPEENYSFKPSPDVRSFGQIHRAYRRCSVFVLFGGPRRNEPRAGNRKEQDIQGRSGEGSQRRTDVLR